MDQAKANQYAAQLGFTPERVQALQALPTFEEAEKALEELKKDAKSRYRKLVFQHHPDRNQGDASSTEKLSDLAQVMKHIESLNIQRRVPQPMQIHFVHHQPFVQHVHVRTAPQYSTSTSTGTTTTYYATRVAFVRPV